MNKLRLIITSRWFITLLGALALSLLIWFVGPLIAIADYRFLGPDWVRMLCVLLVMMVWGGSNLYRQVNATKNEKSLEKGIVESGADASESHDISAVKSQVSEAVEILKKSGQGKKRSNSLYELPWYLMIGPPGSGKTTALVNSGLHFPLEDKYGKSSIKGVGGTRNCDWWFTEEAVLIDTAGRYTTQDSHAQADRAEWKGFIDLLKKHRKRRPINGVIIAISMQDILLKTQMEMQAQIKAIRARLQEISEDLGVHVPIYLLFTKCDLVEGFLETFEAMNKEQREQVWGMTLPQLKSHKGRDHSQDINYQHWLEQEYDVLVDRLQEQQLGKFYNERDIERRNRIINFPHRLRGVKDKVAEFVGLAFTDSRFHDQFMLRGIYFTSGTQEGSAINRAISQMANPLGIQSKVLSGLQPKGRSYFIQSLLTDVVFAESELVTHNRKVELLGRWVRSFTAFACIAVLVAAGAGLSVSLGNNQLSLSKVDALSHEFRSRLSQLEPDVMPIQVAPLYATYQNMFSAYQNENEIFDKLGLYQGDRVIEALNLSAKKFTQHYLVSSIRNQLESELRSQTGNSERLRNTLKAYLMLNDAEHFDEDYLFAWFESHWNNKYFDQPEEKQMLLQELTALLEEFDYIELDNELVADTRKILRDVPLAEQVFFAIKSEADFEYNTSYRFSTAIGSDYYRVFEQSDHQIPRFYTFKGFTEYFKPGLARSIAELSDDNWVVGNSKGQDQNDLTDMDLAEVKAKVEKRYYDEYIAHWEKHLFAVLLKTSTDLDTTEGYLDVLRSGRSPLRAILDEVSLNTQLTISVISEEDIEENLQGAQQAARMVDPRAAKFARISTLAARNRFANMPETPTSMVDKRFSEVNRFVEAKGSRPPQIDVLMESLAELQVYIENIINGGAITEEAYQAALLRFNGNKKDVISRLKLESRHYPEPINRWVSKLVDTVWSQVVAQAHYHIAKEYQHSLWPVYESALYQKYPFIRNASREAAITDFASFFRKDGDVDLFFNEYLKPFVDTSVKPWRLKRVDGHSIGIKRHYLKQFELADRIRSSFFGRESDPMVSFSIRPIYLDANVSRLELNMMGDRQVYRHGPPQSKDIVWPPLGLESTISYQLEDAYGSKDGDRIEGAWSLFRFIDRYPLAKNSHGNRYQLEIEMGGKRAVYELIAATSKTPLGKTDLANFRLPKTL